MVTPVKKSQKLSSEESAEWFRSRMEYLGITSLEELHRRTGIDKGSLSRYFRQERIPSIDVIAPLCEALEVSPESLLIALGAIGKRSR